MTEVVSVASATAGTTDPETLEPVPGSAAGYEGPARLKWVSTTVSDGDAAGQVIATQDVVLKVPVTAPRLAVSAVVTVLSSSIDPGLAGRKFRVRGRPASGQVTAHRYTVEEIS